MKQYGHRLSMQGCMCANRPAGSLVNDWSNTAAVHRPELLFTGATGLVVGTGSGHRLLIRHWEVLGVCAEQ